MDFSRLEWGIDAKGSGGRKATEIPHTKRIWSYKVGMNCKEWGQNATWGGNATWVAIAKGAVESQRLLKEVGAKRNSL